MRILFLLVAIVGLAGCTDAQVADRNALGKEHSVKLYSGGEKIGEWVSTGHIKSEESGDGFYFCDKETRNVVRISGDVIVTPITKK